MDIEEMRARQALLKAALSPTSTVALEGILIKLTASELRHVRKVYKEECRHVTRVQSERIAIIERAIREHDAGH